MTGAILRRLASLGIGFAALLLFFAFSGAPAVAAGVIATGDDKGVSRKAETSNDADDESDDDDDDSGTGSTGTSGNTGTDSGKTGADTASTGTGSNERRAGNDSGKTGADTASTGTGTGTGKTGADTASAGTGADSASTASGTGAGNTGADTGDTAGETGDAAGTPGGPTVIGGVEGGVDGGVDGGENPAMIAGVEAFAPQAGGNGGGEVAGTAERVAPAGILAATGAVPGLAWLGAAGLGLLTLGGTAIYRNRRGLGSI